MDAETARILQRINLQFYQTFASPFSATRQRLQPGVKRVIETIADNACLLDLGCGNGEMAYALFHRGHQGIYLGIDASAELLAAAKDRLGERPQCALLQADLTDPGWSLAVSSQARHLPGQPVNFDVVTAFAVLHHIPGAALRRQVLSDIRKLIHPAGELIHSEWQFLNSNRLRSRILPWDMIGVDDRAVDEGDYLLDWRQGGFGVRYVHAFSEAELSDLADETGFSIRHTFLSDGEGDRLALYQRWQPI